MCFQIESWDYQSSFHKAPFFCCSLLWVKWKSAYNWHLYAVWAAARNFHGGKLVSVWGCKEKNPPPCARNSLGTAVPGRTSCSLPRRDEKQNTQTCETVMLRICGRGLKMQRLIYEWEPLFLSSPSSLSCSSAVKWTCAPLRGKVACLPVVVRLCMNQSGDKAAGRMADATARKLFN